jgi:hypothetical protein
MGLLLLILIALLIAQFGFWEALVAVLGAVAVLFLAAVLIVAALVVAGVMFVRSRLR